MIRIILGFSVALIALFSFAVAGLLAGKPAFEACRPYIAAAMAVIGVVAWFFGRVTSRREMLSRNAEDDEDTFSLRDLRYWGPMLVILGVITLFIWPLGTPPADQTAVAPAPSKVVRLVAPQPKAAPRPVLAEKPVVKFPAMRIQGVIVRDDNSFAIINGKSYSVGDHVGDAVVRSIERESVEVELNGEVKLLTIN
jgi:hypothetical protein